MEQLIPVINKLQDVFATVGSDTLQLPQIVVVGAQSSGKSSVLESLVGRDFLPRGTGIVTRRPLILQLIHRTQSQSGATEWGEFLHLPGRMFTDFTEIRDEIIRETDRLSGTNKGISNTPINLRVYSPHVLNLTLVDLPGITKIPVGDQPDDIEQQVYELIMHYIQNPNSIILAVSAANTDIANSDALKLARKADPEGMGGMRPFAVTLRKRTIGVCTKLDLMDAGTDAMDVLTGKVVPVKLGFIAVMNRSQQDINANVSVKAALKTEEQYFRMHPVYGALCDRAGTAYLAKTLNKLLMHHIRDCLPELRQRVSTVLAIKQQELSETGDDVLESMDKGGLMLNALTKFATSFNQVIEGTNRDLSTRELSGGARICYIFHETFGATLAASDALEGLTVSDIRTAIRNATGARRALFVPEVSFELLVKRQIQRLTDPSLRCAELVHEEMVRIAAQCEDSIGELRRFTGLRQRINDVVIEFLRTRLDPTQQMIESIVGMELAYINTNHPDFVGGQEAVSQIMERRQSHRHPPNPHSLALPNVPADPHGLSHKEIEAYLQEQAAYANARANGHYEPGSAENLAAPEHQQPRRSIFGGWLFGGSARDKQDTHVRHIHSDADAYEGPRTVEGEEMSLRDQMETELIQSLITSYFDVVRKNIQDSVPKAIMLLLVNHVKDRLQSHLVSELYRRENFDALLSENPETVEQRKKLRAMVKALKRAQAILMEVRDTALA